jgi:hypothetical protein
VPPIVQNSRKVSTEACLRREFIAPERSSKVLSSRFNGKDVPGSGSVSRHESEQLQSVLSPETLARSENSIKTRSSGSVDSATWSSDAVSISQKLYPKARSPFQRLGNNSDHCKYLSLVSFLVCSKWCACESAMFQLEESIH